MPLPAEYQELIKDGCPLCGESLVIRTGKYGEFIACSEWCGYRKSIRGRSEFPPPKKRTCPRKQCDGSGLIPFMKNGKVIPHAHIFCDCHPQYGIDTQERYKDIRPEDYDFPLSDSFRAMTFEHCGAPDPGYVPPKPEPQTQVIEHRHYDLSDKDYASLRQLEREVLFLKSKLGIITKPKKTERKEYKGLSL